MSDRTLEELKNMGKRQLETQLDMLEILFSLPMNEQQEFGNWYKSHPYYKGFYDVVDIVRGRARDTDGESKDSGCNSDNPN